MFDENMECEHDEDDPCAGCQQVNKFRELVKAAQVPLKVG